MDGDAHSGPGLPPLINNQDVFPKAMTTGPLDRLTNLLSVDSRPHQIGN